MPVQYKVYYVYPDESHLITNLMSLNLKRALHPREDSFDLSVAGIVPYEVGREIFVYRINPEINETVMLFRGIITKKAFEISSGGKITKLSGRGLWYALETKLLRIPNQTPEFYPENPYIFSLNPTLNYTFGMIFTGIMENYKASECSAYIPVIERGTTDFESVQVNDYILVQYSTPGETLERLVSTALTEMVGEFKLDFTQSTPTLSIVKFDPANNLYGIGQDKSSTFVIIEGQNAVEMDFSFDYEEMGNSIVVSGGKFMGADIIEAELVRDDASIKQYGLKQITKPLGSCVSENEIRTYIYNLLPLLSQPIPSLNVRFIKDFFLKTQLVNPGDIVKVYGDSLTNIFGSNTITARVRVVEIAYSIDKGEEIELRLSYPVQKAPQFITGFAQPSLNTLMGSFKREVRDALYTTLGGAYEYLPINFSFELKDTTLKDVYVAPIDITSEFIKKTFSSSVDFLIKSVKLIVNGTTNVEPKVSVYLIAPDASKVFSRDVELGSKYDLTLAFSPVVDSSLSTLTEYSGRYIMVFKNTSNNTYGKYTASVQIGFVRTTTKNFQARGGLGVVLRGGLLQT